MEFVIESMNRCDANNRIQFAPFKVYYY